MQSHRARAWLVVCPLCMRSTRAREWLVVCPLCMREPTERKSSPPYKREPTERESGAERKISPPHKREPTERKSSPPCMREPTERKSGMWCAHCACENQQSAKVTRGVRAVHATYRSTRAREWRVVCPVVPSAVTFRYLRRTLYFIFTWGYRYRI